MIINFFNGISETTMLVNSVDNTTMGFLIEKEGPEAGIIVKEYEPAIMWNLKVLRLVRTKH